MLKQFLIFVIFAVIAAIVSTICVVIAYSFEVNLNGIPQFLILFLVYTGLTVNYKRKHAKIA
ncbi:hypothetical protein RZE82_00495 [Mollicutes bacterium LVI A0039]|nr:hypothetical protein RZE82_00495 [Mollicutes bacterium LVI A0039]